MQRVNAFVLAVSVSACLAGCVSTTERGVTTTSYIPDRTVTTTTTYPPAYVAPVPAQTTSQVVTTVTTNPDGTVRRTTTKYYYPGTTYTYVNPDDDVITSDVKVAFRQDPEIGAHTRSIAVGSDAGIVEITGTADSVSTVQQASWDALQVSGVRQVDNAMVIDPTSPG
jgi:BON domain